MRELKFRMIDKETKEISYTYLESMFANYDNDSCDLDQWTGLQDKNGKDIYESDIVDTSSFPTIENCKIVTFENGCFYPFNQDWYISTECEIIGNIHQHS